MERITTEDGSITFRHPDYLEPYHTKSGGVVEAFEKHARALKIWEKNEPIIFDICSGLSYNAACAFEEIRRHGNNSLVTVYLFENDRSILEKCLELPDSIEYFQDGRKESIGCYHHFKSAIKEYLDAAMKIYEFENIKIIIIFGDAIKTLDSVGQNADFVFFAPFSPAIQPEMWNSDFFRKIYSHMSKDAKLSTYSFARNVREALSQAGFSVMSGPILGRRSPSLIAHKIT